MYVAGNAAATAGNIVANAELVRMAVVSDLFQATVFVFLGLTLYLLLQHVNQSAVRAMVVLVALAAGIVCLNTVFEFEGLRVATGAVTTLPANWQATRDAWSYWHAASCGAAVIWLVILLITTLRDTAPAPDRSEKLPIDLGYEHTLARARKVARPPGQ